MSREKSQKKNGKALAALSMALMVGAGAFYTSAYLTDSETTTNTFTVGDVSIEVEEPHYPGNDHDLVKDLVPNEIVDKDVVIENSGKNEAIVFVTADIPMGKVVTFADKAADINTAPTNQELFTLIKADGTFNNAKLGSDGAASTAGKGGKVALKGTMNSTNLNAKWTLLKTVFVKNGKTSDTDSSVTIDNAEFTRYIYGYNYVIGKGETTHTPVFSQVMLNNFVEGYVDNTAKDIVIKGYGIQAANLKNVTVNSVNGDHVVSIAAPAQDQSQTALTGEDEIAEGTIKGGTNSPDVDGTSVEQILNDVYNVYIAQNNEYSNAYDADNNNSKDRFGNERTATATTKLAVDMSISNTEMRIDEVAIGSVSVDTNLSEKGYDVALSANGIVSISEDDEAKGTFKVTALKPGTVTVSATSKAADKNGNHAVAQVTITVRDNTQTEVGQYTTIDKDTIQTNGNQTSAGN